MTVPLSDSSNAPVLDWSRGELRSGLVCYQAQQFFEAHEHWEIVWLRSPEPEKTLLQAIIQVAASFHHLRRGNEVGARSLLAAALRRLELYPATHAGVAIEALRNDICAWINALNSCETSRPPNYPRIV